MIRTFNVVVSKTQKGFVATCENMILGKGHAEETFHDMLEVLKQTSDEFNEKVEPALVRVFVKGRENPVRVF
jgi:hypothetical protein